jgi:hypothetical protein
MMYLEAWAAENCVHENTALNTKSGIICVFMRLRPAIPPIAVRQPAVSISNVEFQHVLASRGVGES